jgi:hypothetical protein
MSPEPSATHLGPSRHDEWRWYCTPCPHCRAGHDEIAVLEPGCEPPRTEQEIDEAATIDYYDWPESAYG